MEKLLSCPFCNHEATLTIHMCSRDFLDEDGAEMSGKYGTVQCDGCGIATPQMKIDKAISAWNTRAEPENKPLTLDELREMGGEPVWSNTRECYGLVDDRKPCEMMFMMVDSRDRIGVLDDYYRHKPAADGEKG